MSVTSSYPQLLRRILALLTAVVLVSWGTAALSQTDAVANNQVCSGLDSGKIDVSGEKPSITVSAPDGMLISGYCVKAGSTKNGNGPRYVTLSQPQESVTLTYSGKGISHYSLSYDRRPTRARGLRQKAPTRRAGALPDGMPRRRPQRRRWTAAKKPRPRRPRRRPQRRRWTAAEHRPTNAPTATTTATMDGCGTPPDDCPDGDHNGDKEGCGRPARRCPDGDHNGDMDGCEAPPEDAPTATTTATWTAAKPRPKMPRRRPQRRHGRLRGRPRRRRRPDRRTSLQRTRRRQPWRRQPRRRQPRRQQPRRQQPGGNDAGGTEVLGAQASIGAGAPSGAGSSAPSAGATQVPTAVNAGLEDPDPASTGLRSALALLMVAFGLFVIGIALTPSRRTAPRHRQS